MFCERKKRDETRDREAKGKKIGCQEKVSGAKAGSGGEKFWGAGGRHQRVRPLGSSGTACEVTGASKSLGTCSSFPPPAEGSVQGTSIAGAPSFPRDFLLLLVVSVPARR